MRTPYDVWFPAAEFDATHGYDLEALRSITAPPEPPGFAEFWSDLYSRARAVVVDPELRRVSRHGALEVCEVEYTSLGGVRIGGWMVQPASGEVDRAFVIGHGYGGREAPDLRLPAEHAAAIFPCARGLPSRSLMPAIPAEPADHVLHGIAAPSSYVLGGCAADLWCATSALLQLLASKPSRIDYLGVSFGGGVGALALPWEERLSGGVLMLPTFGHHDLRLSLRCTGSGDAVRRHAEGNPAVHNVLRYFDAATAARRITVPTLVAAALWDPAVPPPGQVAVYNELAGPKELFLLSAGHETYPAMDDENEQLFAAATAFLS